MVTAPNKQPLAGRRVLVCRPQPRADELCKALREAGAEARALPMMELVPRELDGRDRAVIQDLDLYQHVIAVSPSAAEILLERIDPWWPQWPIGVQWWGVGSGTASTLQKAGLPGDYPEAGYTSEALLAHPDLQADALGDARVLIAKGASGRPVLQDCLIERGARVDTLVLYHRRAPEYDEATLQAYFSEFNPDTVITLSGETLNNLLQVVQNTDPGLFRRRLIVPVSRVAEDAEAAGFTDTVIPGDLSPTGLIAACAQQGPATAPNQE